MTSLSRAAIAILTVSLACCGCSIGDLGTDVPHKPHAIATGPNHKGGGADMDLLPAPPGMVTGTPK